MPAADAAGMLPAKPATVMSTTTRIFLSYAAQDADYRSLLVGAARAARLPVQFVELPGHVSDVQGRDHQCRAKLQECDMALVLASPHAVASPSVAADMRCAAGAGLPVHAVHAGGPRASVRLPAEWSVESTLGWSWAHIARLLQRPCAQTDATLRIAC
jgi:hypothetical protein